MRETLKEDVKIYVYGDLSSMSYRCIYSIFGSHHGTSESIIMAKNFGEWVAKQEGMLICRLDSRVERAALKGALLQDGVVAGVYPGGELSENALLGDTLAGRILDRKKGVIFSNNRYDVSSFNVMLAMSSHLIVVESSVDCPFFQRIKNSRNNHLKIFALDWPSREEPFLGNHILIESGIARPLNLLNWQHDIYIQDPIGRGSSQLELDI
ncbi:hypothetical protein JW979_08950 [bacterium]|nr:hypothetical protein [candidate division CSSED10-310 bacterium]